jgi:hypothetical protein
MDLTQLRHIALMCGAQEIYLNEVSKVISFRVGFARVNIYYTTGTVGTCIEHPVSGKTQLFRRNQTISTVATIFRDPRVHTGAGYYQTFDKIDKKRKVNNMSVEEIEEEEALKQQLQSLSEISDELKAQQQLVTDALQTFETKRELQRQEVAQKAAAVEKQRQVVIAQQQQQEMRRLFKIDKERIRARGTGWDINFETDDEGFVRDSMIHDDVSCVAMSGTNVLMLYDNGSFSCNNAPKQLRNKLTGRQKSLPKPEYVALGPDDAYYVRFADRSSQWGGITDDNFEDFIKKERVEKVAFSADGGWFVSSEGGGFEMSRAFGDLCTKLKWPSNRKRTIENISLGSHEAYFVSFIDGHWIYGPATNDHYYYNYNLNNLVERMNSLRKIRHVYFGASADDWVIRYQK